MMKKLLILLCLCVTAALFGNVPKYVFLFIGDGMSIPQRMMTDEFLRKTSGHGLLINQLPVQAVTTTASATSFITDSAAAATAIACGEKTANGRIGMDTTGKRKLESVAEVAEKSGKKVGIITTVTINHATPAGFYAKNVSRGNYYQIALDLVDSGFDFFCGGVAHNNRTNDPEYRGDIYALAQKNGFNVVRDKETFAKLDSGSGKTLVALTSGSTPYTVDAQNDGLRLADFVGKAIEVLDNEKGFFIMAEGGKIDWMCHSNDAGTALHEVIEFDQAVQVAYDFARKHPEETLIVVTGDHETGGLTLGFGGTGYCSYIELLGKQKVSSGRFHELLQKAGKEGGMTFEKAKSLITDNFGLSFADVRSRKTRGTLLLSESEKDGLRKAYDRQFKNGVMQKNSALTQAVVKCFNNKASLAWTSGAHTALPVLTTSCGVKSELFANQLDNTDIAKKLKEILR